MNKYEKLNWIALTRNKYSIIFYIQTAKTKEASLDFHRGICKKRKFQQRKLLKIIVYINIRLSWFILYKIECSIYIQEHLWYNWKEIVFDLITAYTSWT